VGACVSAAHDCGSIRAGIARPISRLVLPGRSGERCGCCERDGLEGGGSERADALAAGKRIYISCVLPIQIMVLCSHELTCSCAIKKSRAQRATGVG
jgi:hypothetical protein